MEAEKAAFMGKVTAAATHEMKNVLAIIKESVGLMEDIIAMTKDDSLPHRDKFVRSLARIMEQVARGVDLSTRLNAFAHSSDEARARVDLNRAVEQSAFACHRAARLHKITLKPVPCSEPVEIDVDPMGLQMVLFQCVDLLMNVLGSGSTVTLEVSKEASPRITIAGTEGTSPSEGVKSPARDGRWETLQTAAQGLNLVLEEAEGPGPGLRVVLS
ncbi:MAG: hypothetical protein AB1646_17895 [Thermodesulfobacteriota bacterium]